MFKLDVTPRTSLSVRDGRVTVLREQDAEPIVALAKENRARQRGFGANYRFVGTLPNVMVERLIHERFGPAFMRLKASERMQALKQAVSARLNDPDYKDFRG